MELKEAKKLKEIRADRQVMQTKLRLCRSLRQSLEKFAEESNNFGEDLACLCAISSWILKELFERNGFRAKFVLGKWNEQKSDSHCWVESDSFLFDLTATQFSDTVPKVLVVPVGDSRFVDGREATLEDIESWPFNQQPMPITVSKITKTLFVQAQKVKKETLPCSL